MDVREAETLLEPVARAYGVNTRWLRVRTADYFGTLDFSGQVVLDIGAGKGLYACAVGKLGAKEIVAIEPEAKGSRQGVAAKLQTNAASLNLTNLTFHTVPLQAFETKPQRFDLIYMLAVINHLDEDAVQTLHIQPESRDRYIRLLRPIYDWLKPGGRLVVSDASRWHLYRPLVRLGLLKRHPFQPTIEWEKHQRPRVWQEILGEIGFVDTAIRWATNWRYPWMPRPLVDNVIAAHLYSSLFVLEARRPRHD